MAIKKIIDEELGPILGWTSEEVAEKQISDTVTSHNLATVAKQHPDQFAEIVSALRVHIDLPSSEENERLFTAIADLVTQFDKASIGRVTNLLTAIQKEGTDNIKQLDEALSSWSLSQHCRGSRNTKAFSNDRTFTGELK